MKKYLATFIIVLTAGVGAYAGVVAQWNFNSTAPDANTATGTLIPSVGTGTATNIGGTTFTFATGSPGDTAASDNSGWNLTSYPSQGTASRSAGAQFSASTVGFAGQIQLQLDFRQSGTASRSIQLQVSSDGTNFFNVSGGTAVILGPTNSGNVATFFSSTGLYTNNPGGGSQNFVEGIQYTFAPGSVYQNDPNFAFRFVSVFDPGPAGGGTNYIAANAGTAAGYGTSGTTRFDMVSIQAVPEPSTIALVLTALAGAFVVRRRQ